MKPGTCNKGENRGYSCPGFIWSRLRRQSLYERHFGAAAEGADGMFERALSSSVLVASTHAFMLSFGSHLTAMVESPWRSRKPKPCRVPVDVSSPSSRSSCSRRSRLMSLSESDSLWLNAGTGVRSKHTTKRALFIFILHLYSMRLSASVVVRTDASTDQDQEVSVCVPQAPR